MRTRRLLSSMRLGSQCGESPIARARQKEDACFLPTITRRSSPMSTTLQDAGALRDEIRATYRDVARDPGGEFHFETGRALAARLGYPPEGLDAVAPGGLARFAGVGHFLDLAAIEPGATVLDLGSGSGPAASIAAPLAGPGGSVIGVDMTVAQLASARRHAPSNVEFVEGL